MNMKKFIAKSIIILTAALVLLTGCSALMGAEGDAYIAYSWVSVSYLYTEDPSFGSTVYNEVYEDASEGTWYFEYTSLGEAWTGSYTIYRNPGVLFHDGEDIYFELCLYSFGPSFYEWTEAYARSPRGDEYTETFSAGGYTVELHARRGEEGRGDF